MHKPVRKDEKTQDTRTSQMMILGEFSKRANGYQRRSRRLRFRGRRSVVSFLSMPYTTAVCPWDFIGAQRAAPN